MASLVSAIIPTRDRPELAERAVASALAQTWAPLEVVVADDGSRPLAITGALEDSRVRVVRLAEPAGAAGARNTAVAEANGELLAFLDDDDEWLPDKIARQAPLLLAAGPDVASVACGYDLWDGEHLVQRVHSPSGDLRLPLLSNPCLAPSTVLLRRSAYEAVGGFHEEVERCEDWDFWVRLADRFRFAALPEVLVDRRLHVVRSAEELEAVRAMVGRLAHRIDSLPPGQRAKVRAHHDLVFGVRKAEIGRRREARGLMWSAWRRHPRSPRPLIHMLRTVIGEPTWRRAAGRLRRPRGSMRGSPGPRDPRAAGHRATP